MSDIEIIKKYGSIENYIYKLEQKNKELKEKINTYENPEDLTLMFMYCDEKAKDKIKQLKEVIEKISNNILNETTTFCESCASKDCCPEEDCVLYRIEKLVDKDSDK